MKKIVVECNPDELLARALGLGRKEIAHQNSKGEVCHYLKNNDVRIAVIDEDPGSGQPNYLKTFIMAEEKFGIKKIVQNNTQKIILIIKPRLEEWILSQCEKSNIDPGKFFLPNNAKQLKDVINLRLNHFDNLLKELANKESEGLKYLQAVILNAYK